MYHGQMKAENSDWAYHLSVLETGYLDNLGL